MESKKRMEITIQRGIRLAISTTTEPGGRGGMATGTRTSLCGMPRVPEFLKTLRSILQTQQEIRYMVMEPTQRVIIHKRWDALDTVDLNATTYKDTTIHDSRTLR